MENFHWRQLIGLFLLLGTSIASHADVITVTGDDTSINVPLPTAALQKGSKLSVELDGYDVTSIAAVQEGQLQFSTQSLSLKSGQHVLRIVRTAKNGDLETLVEYTLDVFQRPGIRQASHNWNVLLGSSYRIDAHPELTADADRWQGNAVWQWNGDIETEHWIGRGALSSLYNSDRSLSPNRDAWQLPTYELRAGRRFDSGKIALGLGDHTVPLDNLLFSGFSRRGLGLEADALDSRVRAQAYTLITEPTTQLDADVVPTDPHSSVLGGYATLMPFAAHPDALLVSMGWTDGEGTLGGVGINASDPFASESLASEALRIGGRAWNMALDTFGWRRAVWLHAEHARSVFDGDGIGIGHSARSDDANHVIVQVASGGDFTLPVLDQWTLGYERRRIGSDFYSLGNLMLVGDLDLHRAYAQLGWHGVNLAGDFSQHHTDVNNDPERARVHSRRHSLAFSYTPQQFTLERGPWRWLGMPSIGGGIEASDNHQAPEEALLTGFDLDNTLRNQHVELNFAHNTFSFGLSVADTERIDRTSALVADNLVIYRPTPDTHERTYGISWAWYPGSRLMIAPQWQYSRSREIGTENIRSTELWGLQFQAAIVPEVLTLQADWSDARDEQLSIGLPLDRQRLKSSGGSFDIRYRMLTPKAARPSLDWRLRGILGRNRTSLGTLAQSDRQWQVLLSIDLYWTKES